MCKKGICGKPCGNSIRTKDISKDKKQEKSHGRKTSESCNTPSKSWKQKDKDYTKGATGITAMTEERGEDKKKDAMEKRTRASTTRGATRGDGD